MPQQVAENAVLFLSSGTVMIRLSRHLLLFFSILLLSVQAFSEERGWRVVGKVKEVREGAKEFTLELERGERIFSLSLCRANCGAKGPKYRREDLTGGDILLIRGRREGDVNRATDIVNLSPHRTFPARVTRRRHTITRKDGEVIEKISLIEKLDHGRIRRVRIQSCKQRCTTTVPHDPHLLEPGAQIRVTGQRTRSGRVKVESITKDEKVITPPHHSHGSGNHHGHKKPSSKPGDRDKRDTPTPVVRPGSLRDKRPIRRGGILFTAKLRPEDGVMSNASGVASLRVFPRKKLAYLTFRHSTLSAPSTGAHIHGPGGIVLMDIDTSPQNRSGALRWELRPIGELTVEAIVEILKEGTAYINIHTTAYPSGELRGDLLVRRKVLPTRPPTSPSKKAPSQEKPLSIPDKPRTVADAVRFLQQATFGATDADIAAVMEKGYEQYLEEQFNAPQCEHLPQVEGAKGRGESLESERTMEAWWRCALTGSDQLRQRVAFALSQIFVVSEINSSLDDESYALSSYVDLLAKNAFSTYRQLLQEVTLHPAMGVYLNMRGNEKEDPSKGTTPNENYAREVLQLFSIGLEELNQDGTLKLDRSSAPIATYEQQTVEGFAKVFTGWTWALETQNWYGRPKSKDDSAWRRPMILMEDRHSTSSKRLLKGEILPAGQGGEKDLNDALDAIARHPNVGPFITRRLIQRLVTSNPSPAYIGRVSKVFADNGLGVRGDLRATIKAILLDPEARHRESARGESYGHHREPVLILSTLLRSFGATPPSGRFKIHHLETMTELYQNPLRAKTVFNFFEPDYAHPGKIAAGGLSSPEFQLSNDTTVLARANFFWDIISRGYSSGQDNIAFDLSKITDLSTSPQTLMTRLDELLLGGMMSEKVRVLIEGAISAVPESNKELRAKTALYLTVLSPDFTIQR